MLKRMFGRNRDEATERWRKLRNEELHNLKLVTFHQIVLGWLTKDGTCRAWTVCGREQTCVQNFGWEVRRDHLEDLGVDARKTIRSYGKN
jgi:predicted metal-binding protein